MDLLTESQISSLKRAFTTFDDNGDGKIATKEIGNVMRLVEQNYIAVELQNMVNEVDAGGNETIDFHEFLNLVCRNMKEDMSEEELREAFQYFDEDNNGVIPVAQVRHFVMTYLGEDQATCEKFNYTFREFIVNGVDGQISCEEFVKIGLGE